MRTPVEVTDELFTRKKGRATDKQLVEITAHLTLVNLDRFNAAFGIGSAGFSEGMVCLVPDRPAVSRVGPPSSGISLRSEPLPAPETEPSEAGETDVASPPNVAPDKPRRTVWMPKSVPWTSRPGLSMPM
jgi:hypothetical protein